MTAEFSGVGCRIDHPALIERRYRKRIIRSDSLKRQAQAVCFGAAAVPPATGRVARHRTVRRVLSATLDNPAAYRPRACLSFQNAPSRKVERKSLRKFQS